MKTYITGILPTKVSDLTNDSGYLTTETDPTVPSWAKQSNKPSYTASEVGAVSDVQVNGTSVVDNGVAEIQKATASVYGVSKYDQDYGIGANDVWNTPRISGASSAHIKTGTHQFKPIVPIHQHESTFYGLAKAAGDTTQASSSNPVGTYTDDAKSAIKSMLGFLTDTDYATDQAAGIVRVNNKYGIILAQNGLLSIDPATSTDIKAGTSLNPLVPIKQHVSTFYGLAKAAGDTTQASSDNAVGTYTDAAKTAIKSMLDIPDGGDYVTKDSVNNAGITGRTYTDLFNGEFSVTTATTSGYLKPYARASVTGRFNKENMHRVTINGTEYTLQTRMWYEASDTGTKVYEYLGNLSYYISDVSGVPGGTDNVPFLIISDLNNNSSIDVLTNSAGTYTIKVEKVVETKRQIPRSLLYNNYYEPILKKDASGSTYNGFSIGVNELNNGRATFAFGYGNKISNEFSTAIGVNNAISGRSSIAIGGYNDISGKISKAIGTGLIANSVNLTVLGSYNLPANTDLPLWDENVSYKKGDIVVLDEDDPDPVICTEDHVSHADISENDYWVYSASDGDSLLIIGGGISPIDRRNAFKLSIGGRGYFSGDVYVRCEDDSTGGAKLATVNEIPDIKINGTSIVNDGVANIPVAGDGINSSYGVTRYAADYGVSQYQGYAAIGAATDTQIKNGTAVWKPIVAGKQHQAVFYGLAKVAGADMASSSNAVGTYTDTAKAAIKSMLGVPNNVYDLNKGTALPANADLNDYVTPGVYCTDSTTISTIENSPTTFEFKMIVEKINEDYGKQIVIDYWGYHYERAFTILDGVLLAWKKVITGEDYATSSKAGLVRVSNTFGTYVDSNYPEYIRIYRAQESDIKSGANGSNYALYRPITPQVQKNAVFYGLAEAAGDTTQSQSSNTIGTYTNEAKTAIRNMLGISSGGGGGTGAVDDVQVNGTSIVSNGVANIPVTSNATPGLVKISGYGLWYGQDGFVYVNKASSAQIKLGEQQYMPIVPYNQHEATFFGLAKVAGDTTQSASSNAVGTYTDEAKTAIKNMIGVPTMQEIITAVHESYASAEEVSF